MYISTLAVMSLIIIFKEIKNSDKFDVSQDIPVDASINIYLINLEKTNR